ncbi:TatD family hydrolase [bacterium]|nr:TatD family hydrolase [bacterium]
MIIDTHCHLDMMVKKNYEENFSDDLIPKIGEIVAQAELAGITNIINVGVDLPSSEVAILLAKNFPMVFASVGIHPCDLSDEWEKDIEKIDKLAEHAEKNKIVAVGETGMDFYHKPFDAVVQEDAFRAQIEIALKYDLPLIVHMRDATDETIKVLEEFRHELRCVMHCFSGGLDVARELADWGFYIGIDGPVTYPKNEGLREVVREIDLSQLLVETDAPFLSPQKKRGERNTPAFLPLILNEIARQRNLTVSEVATATTKNARKLFKIPS